MDKILLNNIFEFDIKDQLGKGSYGTVYKGKNIKTGQIVAIKSLERSLLLDNHSNHDFIINQLRKEVNLMQELSCENVVKIIDLAGTETHIYLIIEYCAGGDLRQLLEQDDSKFSEAQAIQIISQVLEGLKSMVKRGYVHRDIKPENILIGENKIFKIGDFGFATQASDQEVLKECVGSPLYMSPQLLQKKSYSSKSDVWAIGLVYYEIIYGKLPWICRDIGSLLLQIRKVPVRFPLEKPISMESKDFIKKCLEFEEQNRLSWEQVFDHPLFKKDKKYQTLSPQIQNRQTSQEKRGTSADVKIITLQNKQVENTKHINKIENSPNKIVDTLQQPQKENVFIDKKEKEKKDQLEQNNLNSTNQQIITMLQDVVQFYKLNPKELFNHFDSDNDGKLQFSEFSSLLRRIDKLITANQAQNVFEVSTQNSRYLSFEQFKTMVSGKDTSKAQSQAGQFLTKLHSIITQNKIDINQLFKDMKNISLQIDFEAFCSIIERISPKEDRINIKSLFDKLSLNDKVNASDLKYALLKIKLEESDNSSTNKVFLLIKELRSVIISKGIDSKQVFNNFSVKGHGSMKLLGLKKLAKIVDEQIDDSMVSTLFKYMDANNDGEISLTEFQIALDI